MSKVMKRPCRGGMDRDEMYGNEAGSYRDKRMARQKEKRDKLRREGYLTIQMRAKGQDEKEMDPKMEVVLKKEKKDLTMTWGSCHKKSTKRR